MSDDLLSSVRRDIVELAAYRVADAEGMVKLDAMENPYALSQALRASLADRLSGQSLNRYPSPVASELKMRLAHSMGMSGDMPMVLGNGSDELIQMLIMACAAQDAVILGVQPSFVMFGLIAQLVRVPYVGVALKDDFSLDREAMLAAVDRHRPALTFLAYPNNPTGNLFDADAVEAIITRAAPGLVVVDEAYYPFTAYSFKDRLAYHPNLILMRTLSKLGLAGLRLGWLCGHAALLAQIDKVRLPYNVSILDQVAASWALDHRAQLDDQVACLVRDRAHLATKMKSLAGLTVFPSEANFLLFRLPQAGQVFEGLRRHGILIKNLSGSHSLLQDCLRVTVGTPEENRQFLDALEQVISLS